MPGDQYAGGPHLGENEPEDPRLGHVADPTVEKDIKDLQEAPGGGAVDSVNGQTGVVVLSAADVGAQPEATGTPDGTKFLADDGSWKAPDSGASGRTTYTVGMTSGDWIHENDQFTGTPVGTVTYVAGVISQTDATAALVVNDGNGPIIQAVVAYPSTSHRVKFDVRFPSGQDAGVVPAVAVIAGSPDAAVGYPFLGEGASVYGATVGDAATFKLANTVDSVVLTANEVTVGGMNVDEWHTIEFVVSPMRQVFYADGTFVLDAEQLSGGNSAPAHALQIGMGGLVNIRDLSITIDSPPA